jgi:hypothetical protein
LYGFGLPEERPLWHRALVLTATDTHHPQSQVVHAGR